MEDFETNDEDEWKLVKRKGSQKRKDTLKALTEDTVPMRITSIKVKGSNETDNSHHESKKLCKLAYSQINVCRYFQNGKCKFGSRCINFHGRSICLYQFNDKAGNYFLFAQTKDESRMRHCSKRFCCEEVLKTVEQIRDFNEPILLTLKYRHVQNRRNFFQLAKEIQAKDDTIAVKIEQALRIPSNMEKFVQGFDKICENVKGVNISIKKERIRDVKNASESKFKSVFFTTGSYNETDETEAGLRKEWRKVYEDSAREAVKEEALRNEMLDRILGIHPQDHA